MNRSGKQAWLVMEWLKGRTQRDIATELNISTAPVCVAIKRFCDEWSDIDVQRQARYGDDRKKVALQALQNFHFESIGNLIEKPDAHPRQPTCSEEQYSWARCEHAWLLRAEGLTLAAIGEHLGVNKERARQMILKFGRRFTRAVWRARWPERLYSPRPKRPFCKVPIL